MTRPDAVVAEPWEMEAMRVPELEVLEEDKEDNEPPPAPPLLPRCNKFGVGERVNRLAGVEARCV